MARKRRNPLRRRHLIGFDNDLILRELPGRIWELVCDVTLLGRYQSFTVRAGYKTDLASTPRLLHWFIPPNGSYSRAAVIHDLLWQMSILERDGQLFRDTGGRLVGRVNGQLYSVDDYLLDPVDVDGVFRRAMRILGTHPVLYWSMWAAVRWAAIFTGRTGRMQLKDWGQLVGVTAAWIGAITGVVSAIVAVS